MLLRIWAMTRKEFIHIRRDPRTLGIMIIMPLVQLILLGYAATTDIEHLKTAVVDGDKSSQSRELIDAYRASNYFDIVAYVDNEEEAGYLLDKGTIRAAIVIPAGYGEELSGGSRPEVAFFIDGSDPQVANIAFASSQTVAQSKSTEMIMEKMNVDPEQLPGVDVRPRVWYNPNMESANFTIPGLMAIVLYVFAVLFTSMAIVREREQGTIEQLIVTPIRPLEMIVAKIIPFVFVAFADLLEVLLLGVWWFGIPIRGSVPLLLTLSGLFMIVSLALGVFISSIASTQQEAMMATMATMLPSIFLGGLFFPIDAMPWWLQYVSYIIPVRYMMEVIRGIILKGVGVTLLREQLFAMFIIGVVIVGLAATKFKKRLE